MKLFLLSKLKHSLICLICFCTINLFAYNAEKIENQEKFLIEVLEEISKEYKVHFTYDVDLIRELKVEYVKSEIETIEQTLERVLSQVNFSFKIFDNRFVIIYKNDDQGLNSLEEMISHFQGLVEERKSIKNSRKALQVATLDRTQIRLKKMSNTIEVFGTVIDPSGNPLIGVNVVVKGTNNGTATDANGEFNLKNVVKGSTLIFTYIGYQSQEVDLDDVSSLKIVMHEDAQSLDEVIVVGYGVQKKSDLSGAISTIKGEELSQSKTVSLTNSIAGRLPGVVATQRTGEPGKDASSISIRGFGSPLIIVDGIERDFNDLNPEEIESMSILKDASAAIYGARAGNGVILITTKRGSESQSEVSFNLTQTMQGLTFFPNAVNSGQFAEMVNEFKTNDGLDPTFSAEEIQKYYDGSDPLNFPNTNWWDLTMRDWSPQTQADLSLRGGNDKVRYYSLLSRVQQGGMYKSGDNEYTRYNLRNNLDVSITEGLTASVDLSMITEDTKSPNRDVPNLWRDFYDSSPLALGEHPDKTRLPYGGNVPISIIAGTDFDFGGYRSLKNNHINVKTSLKFELPWVQGLAFSAFGSYYQWRSDFKNWQKQYNVWEYNPENDTYIDRGSTFPTILEQGYNIQNSFTTQYSMSYANTFAGKHSIDALLLYELIDLNKHDVKAHGENYITNSIDYLFAAGGEGQTVSGGAGEDGRASYVGRLNYNYDGKYFLQSTVRYDGSPRFNKGNQWGFFPSFSAAWRISEENFIKSQVSPLDNLKLRVSYSNLGYDATGRFQYLSGYQFTSGNVGPLVRAGYVVGGSPKPGLHSTGLANPNITWENMTIYNLGLDFGLYNSMLFGELDVFYRDRTNMLATRASSLPNTFGANLPAENINSLSNRGFELLLGHRKSIKEFEYSVSANVSWTRARWEHYEEPNFEDPDDIRTRKRTGNWVDRTFGYLSDGLFTSQEEIDNLEYDQDNSGNATLAPGDIKYVDVNEDGVLNWRDRVEIGSSNTPAMMFGLNLGANYKGFDLSVLFQGAGQYDVFISPGILPDGSKTPYTLVYENRWHPENNDRNALIPRLSATGNVNNSEFSDFWMVNGAYVRLKNINFGYSLPSNLTKNWNIQKIRLYLAGTNLITISELNKWDYDPEGPSNDRMWYYPQQKNISGGLLVTF